MNPDFTALRERFPTLVERAYFATHGFGPLLRETLRDLDDYRRTLPLRNRVVATWYERVVEIRGLLARLVGAREGDIALGPNATACQASFAAALAPTAQCDTILTTDLDFPSSRYLWHAQGQRGYRVIEVPSRDGVAFPVDELVAAIDRRTAIVAVPLVAYANGALLDVERVIAAAHDAGAIVVLDAYQAAGIVPIDVRALDVDALVSGTNKWLSSAGMGLAFLYVRRSLANRLAPAFPGWFAHEDPLAFADFFVPAHGARRFEQGAPAVEAIYGARAGIQFALEVGVEAIRARSFELTDHLIAGVDRLGIPLATPRAHDERAGVVCLDLADAAAIAETLGAQGIDVDTRPGTGLRVSCHPCNTLEDVDLLLAGLTAARP
ncbi:MAG TPA: aminotransferase class V-fold PLP-dependent enzyme [Kofleriaceae bacterium]